MTDTQTLPPSKPESSTSNSTNTSPPPNVNKSISGKGGKSEPRKSKQRKAPLIWPFAILVLFVFTLSALASVYFWQQLEKQTALIAMLTKDKTAIQNRAGQLENGINQRFNALRGTFETQTAVFNKLKQQSQFNTQQLHDLGARSRTDWLMAETEYLMHLANQRISLEQDVRGAEAILVSADKVLAENDDPGLLMVRQALANEILALQQTQTIDSDGVYIRLSAMIKSLNGLNARAFLSQQAEKQLIEKPLIPTLETVEYEFSWQNLLSELWVDAQKVIVITSLDKPVKPLLTPEQSYYLKQNLRLMLEQASLSLLDKEQTIFDDSIDKASLWMDEYFDKTDPQAKVLMFSLEEMKKIKINPASPDISNSLRLLKAKIEAMYQSHSLGKLSNQSEINEDGEQ